MCTLACSAVGTVMAGACLSGHWFRHVCLCRRSQSSTSGCDNEMQMTQLWLLVPLKFSQALCIVIYFVLFRNIRYMSVKTRNTNFTLNLTKFSDVYKCILPTWHVRI